MADDKYGQGKPLEPLNSRGLAAKREYVRELTLRADSQSLSLLVECLCDESSYLRGLAEEAFISLGEDQAQPLIALLSQGLWFTRVSASRVLGRLGYRRAVPHLFALTEDSNESVCEAAREALVAIGSRHGAVRLAHALHHMPPDTRRKRLEEIASLERLLGERLERLMRQEELMSVHDADSLSDDSPSVRATEEGVEWEVLTGPPPPRQRPSDAGSGHG